MKRYLFDKSVDNCRADKYEHEHEMRVNILFTNYGETRRFVVVNTEYTIHAQETTNSIITFIENDLQLNMISLCVCVCAFYLIFMG